MDTPQHPPSQDPQWEHKLLEKLALSHLEEQKTRRRWGIFFKLLGFAYLTAILVYVVDWGGSDKLADGRHTAVIYLHGTIEANGEASAEKINAALDSAFEDKGTAGVILRINSPGGSPVQAGMINDEIHRLRQKYPKTPLYVVVEDMCASGGYYVAVAGDKIFVDKASMIGSIGVLMDGFGFTGTMDKLGVERRLLTAGENKGFLDPFSPVNPKQKEYAKTMLASAIDKKEHPSVGLLNIGEEDIKGNDVVKHAAELLKDSGLNFVGNVEGDGVFKGDADVVVCDGFVGNVALKTTEGLAQMLAFFLKEEFRRNWLTKLIALIALPVLKGFKKRVDHRRYNGATLLGLKGIVVKSHGSADAFAFQHDQGPG